jgi:hypothetical protein
LISLKVNQVDKGLSVAESPSCDKERAMFDMRCFHFPVRHSLFPVRYSFLQMIAVGNIEHKLQPHPNPSPKERGRTFLANDFIGIIWIYFATKIPYPLFRFTSFFDIPCSLFDIL